MVVPRQIAGSLMFPKHSPHPPGGTQLHPGLFCPHWKPERRRVRAAFPWKEPGTDDPSLELAWEVPPLPKPPDHTKPPALRTQRQTTGPAAPATEAWAPGRGHRAAAAKVKKALCL